MADVLEKTPLLQLIFKKLQGEKAKLLDVVAPARADYERLTNDPRLIECKRIIKESNPKLAAIDNELAGLARALGSRGIKVESGEFASQVGG